MPIANARPSPSGTFSRWRVKNIRVDFLGSDDFTRADREAAARATNDALVAGWDGMPIAEQFPIGEIATAHERVEAPDQRGRVVVVP